MRATWANKPVCKPPADPVHEFLSCFMRTGDPIFITWLKHLKQSGTAYRLKQNGEGKAMLYAHRIVGGELEDGWWCCDRGRPRVRIGRRKIRI